jgi:hypothetical protein
MCHPGVVTTKSAKTGPGVHQSWYNNGLFSVAALFVIVIIGESATSADVITECNQLGVF